MTITNRTFKASLLGLSVAVALGASTVAFAQQQAPTVPAGAGFNSLFGPTGLLSVPTAYVNPQNTIQFGTNFSEEFRTISGNYGLSDYIEVGATFVEEDKGSNKGIVNAKLNVIPSNFQGFQFGGGVIDAFDSLNSTFFVVASTRVLGPPQALEEQAFGVRVHLGYGSGVFNEKVIGGGEIFLDRSFAIVGEYNGDSTNAALRYTHTDRRFRAQFGVYDTEWFFGTSYLLSF